MSTDIGRGDPPLIHNRLLGLALVVANLLALGFWAALAFTTDPGVAVDGWGYYTASADGLYDQAVGSTGAFLYSPAIFQAMEPLRWLAFPDFANAIRALELGALVAVAWPILPLTLVMFLPMELELHGPNIQLLMTLAVVAGFRWPATWAFLLLTKVTPGVGLVWFAVRREWRNLAVALGATAVIAGVSFAIAPGLWLEWIGRLASSASDVNAHFAVPLPPLPVRLVVAAALIAWGARRNARWTVYAGTFLALPVPWISGLVMLLPALRDLVLTGPRLLPRLEPGPFRPEGPTLGA